MDLKTKTNDNPEKNKILELKKEEAILKDQLKRINDIQEHPSKKVFIPLLSNSKLAFFEARTKGTPKIYTNIGDYVIESTIDRKINKIKKLLADIQGETNSIKIKVQKEATNLNNDNNQKIIYDEKQEKIGELKKLNDGLFEIIEDEKVSEKLKLEIESKDKEKKQNLVNNKDNTQKEINRKLEEMKQSRNKYKNPNHINFADLEFQ